MNIYEKLAEARKIIRETKITKDGHNKFAGYAYFTPEQVEELVTKACEATKTICITNLKQDAIGYYQTLDFCDLEGTLMTMAIGAVTDGIHFELRTAAPEIKATNATQQMGGMDTYSERYIKMKVFQIKDNNDDFDAHDNSAKAPPSFPIPKSEQHPDQYTPPAKKWTKPAPKWERKDNSKQEAQLDAGNERPDLND